MPAVDESNNKPLRMIYEARAVPNSDIIYDARAVPNSDIPKYTGT